MVSDATGRRGPDSGAAAHRAARRRGGWPRRAAGPSAAGPATSAGLIDPLDGTTNFRGASRTGASASPCTTPPAPRWGWCTTPAATSCFHATRGAGARLGDRPLRIDGPVPPLDEALVGTGSTTCRRARRQATRVAACCRGCANVRRFGSAALDLAWLAAGRLDAYYETGLNPWDWEAGALLVAEAGGRVECIAAPAGRTAVVIARASARCSTPWRPMSSEAAPAAGVSGEIDLLRTAAIVMMVVYHAAGTFDSLAVISPVDPFTEAGGHFRWLRVDVPGRDGHGDRRHQPAGRARGLAGWVLYRRHARRALTVLGAALLVSIATLVALGGRPRALRHLHCIGVAMLVLPLLMRLRHLLLPWRHSPSGRASSSPTARRARTRGCCPSACPAPAAAGVDWYPLLPWLAPALVGLWLGLVLYRAACAGRGAGASAGARVGLTGRGRRPSRAADLPGAPTAADAAGGAGALAAASRSTPAASDPPLGGALGELDRHAPVLDDTRPAGGRASAASGERMPNCVQITLRTQGDRPRRRSAAHRRTAEGVDDLQRSTLGGLGERRPPPAHPAPSSVVGFTGITS